MNANASTSNDIIEISMAEIPLKNQDDNGQTSSSKPDINVNGKSNANEKSSKRYQSFS